MQTVIVLSTLFNCSSFVLLKIIIINYLKLHLLFSSNFLLHNVQLLCLILQFLLIAKAFSVFLFVFFWGHSNFILEFPVYYILALVLGKVKTFYKFYFGYHFLFLLQRVLNNLEEKTFTINNFFFFFERSIN